MSEIKQEGDFKMPKPRKPKNLGKENEIVKVEILESKVE